MRITRRQLRRIILEMYHGDKSDSISQRLELRSRLYDVANSYIKSGLDRDEVAGIISDVAMAYER